MKKIFENKNYPMIMYLSITIMMVLILFSFANILENQQKLNIFSKDKINKISLTGYTAGEVFVDKPSNLKQYSQKAVNYYYLFLAILYKLTLIIFIVLTYRVKKIFKLKKLNNLKEEYKN
jgi:ABC-type branched-subunit amino acid transport system permease subunit